MKGKKICIGLLIFFITSLLSLNLFSNANAIEKRKNVQNRYINSVEWFYQGRDADNNNASGNMSSNLFNNSILDRITMYANGHDVATLINLKLNLRDNLTISKNKYFSSKIYFLVGPGLNTNNFNVPLCPRGQGYIVIDQCNISHIENISELYRIRDAALDPNDNFSYYQVFTNAKYYYVMELVGHYEGNETTLSQLAFYNNFYTFYNEYPAGVVDGVEVYLYFSPIEQFEYVESATEQEQAQELEDRDNLESQSTSTDNEASTAGQSAENTGTTLFAAFTQFFNALTNVSGASCVLPNMQVYSLNLGQMDLCTYDIPPQIMALVSIGMVFIIVPLGIHLVKKMINLYKEITG